MTTNQAVVLRFNSEKTAAPAYNALARHISDEFEAYGLSMGPPREVYAQDVSDIPEPIVGAVYFVIQEASAIVIYEYLKRNYFDEDSEEDKQVIETNVGEIHIETVEILPAEEAEEVTELWEEEARENRDKKESSSD